MYVVEGLLGSLQSVAKTIHKLSEKCSRMRQLSRKKTEWTWSERENEDFDQEKKMVREIRCLVHFTQDRDEIVTIDAVTTRLGKTLWQNQTDDTLRAKAITSIYLNNSEKNKLIGELDLIALVWRLGKFRFFFCTVK